MSNPRYLLFGKLRASYWFIPGLMAGAAALGAFLSLKLDHNLKGLMLPEWLLLFSGGPDAARDVLSAVAGSIITVAGVTFSISIVILSLTSQQYGPRLLRNFMRDRSIHLAFGMFVATFVFSLLILPSPVSNNDVGRVEFTPRLGVTISIMMAIGSVFMLIYFIHHIARSIQASHIAAVICDELLGTIRSLHKVENDRHRVDDFKPVSRIIASDSVTLASTQSGYFLACDIKKLVDLATRYDVIIEIKVKPGTFIVDDDEIARVSGNNSRQESVGREINSCFSFGNQRTMEQDLGFGFHMLVEMAVRALSPSLNDPFTALQCIDYLRKSFKTLMQMPVPSPIHRDSEGTIRVIQPFITVVELLTSTLSPLHHYAQSAPTVLKGLVHMLESLRMNTGNTEILNHMDAFRVQISKSLTENS